jgi:hypothetical protein
MKTRDYMKILIVTKHEYGTDSIIVYSGDGNLLGENIYNT